MKRRKLRPRDNVLQKKKPKQRELDSKKRKLPVSQLRLRPRKPKRSPNHRHHHLIQVDLTTTRTNGKLPTRASISRPKSSKSKRSMDYVVRESVTLKVTSS